MKGWYALLPVCFLMYGFMIALAVIDSKAIDERVDNAIERQPVLTIQEIIDQRIEDLNSNPETKRVCGRYLSRTFGMKQSWGIVCIDNGMETYLTGSGLFEMSDRHYEEHVLPVVSGLRREYINKYGWE